MMGEFAYLKNSHRRDGSPSKIRFAPALKGLNDNTGTESLGSFTLDVRVPIIGFEEVRKATNPTHSKYYRDSKDLPLKRLISKKAEGKNFRAYLQ